MADDDLLTGLVAETPASRRRVPENYDEIINRHANSVGVDPDLVRAVIGQESTSNPQAVSPKGARGLMQLMPGTAQRFGVKDIHDPEQNIAGGTRYLKFLSDRYNGNVDKVLAGYNAGEGAVDKYGGIPPYKETRNYVPAVKARYQKLTGQTLQTPQPKKDDLETGIVQDDDLLTGVVKEPIDSALTATVQNLQQKSADTKRQQAMQAKVEQARQSLLLPRGQRNLGPNYPVKFGGGQPYKEQLANLVAPVPSKTLPDAVNLLTQAANSPEAQLRDRIREQVRKETPAPLRTPFDENRSPDLTAENAEVERRYQAAQRANTPEMSQIRKEYGQMSAPVRSVAQPLVRGGAGILKLVGGVASVAGLSPNQLSEWANARGQIAEEGSQLAPLDAQGEEIKRSIPEKVAQGIADLGIGVGEIVLLKKATNLPFNQLMALESALKTSNEPLNERAKAATEAYALGTALDQHLGRAASAALFGGPTAIQSASQVARGQMSPEDVLIQTGVQAGAGALLGGKRERPIEPAAIVNEEAVRPGGAPTGDVGGDLAVRPRAADVSPNIPAVGLPAEKPIPPAVEAAERRQVRREFDKIKASTEKPVEVPPKQPAEVQPKPAATTTPIATTAPAPEPVKPVEGEVRTAASVQSEIDAIRGDAKRFDDLPNEAKVHVRNLAQERDILKQREAAAPIEQRVEAPTKPSEQTVESSEMAKKRAGQEGLARNAAPQQGESPNAEYEKVFRAVADVMKSMQRESRDPFTGMTATEKRIKELENAGRTEFSISQDFWQKTYPRLSEGDRARFDEYRRSYGDTSPRPDPSTVYTNWPLLFEMERANEIITSGKQRLVLKPQAAPNEAVSQVEPAREEVIPPSKPAREEKPNAVEKAVAPASEAQSLPISSKGKAGEAPIKPITAPAEPSGIARVPVSELNLDPERFQFKSGHNQKGGTGSLSGVTKWDENLGGIVAVWRDPADGKTYVVNGHNRLEKAQELGVRSIDVKYINAADANEARAVGAKINIAEGQGTALDAATFFRDSGANEATLKAQGIPLTKSVARDGLALSKLDDFIFQAVKRGDLAEEYGVAIGNKLTNPDLQAQAYKAIAKATEKGKNLNKGVVDEMLDAISAAPRESQSEQSLFGDFETERSLFNERAQVAAAIKRQLAGDKTLFGTAARKSSRLAEGGTTVDVEQAKALQESATEALGVFDTLKNRTGGISEILDAGAKRVAAGTRPDVVARETYGKIKQAVSEAIRGGRGTFEQGSVSVPEPSKDDTRQRSLGESEGPPAKAETDLFPVSESEPAFVKAARERMAKTAEQAAKTIGVKGAKKGEAGATGITPQELIDSIIVRGWDLYSEKIKPTFDEWSRKIREEFGPKSEQHLKTVWEQLGGEIQEPSTTSARKAQFAGDRAALDLPELPEAERRSWQETLDRAQVRGTEKASLLADQVLNKPRPLNDVETAQIVLRAQEIKNEHARVMKEIGDAKDPGTIEAKRAEVEALEREFDKLTKAAKASGTEKGRALAAQKLTINQDFDLVSMIQRAKVARGRDLTPEERSVIEKQSQKIADLESQLTEANTRAEKAEAAQAVGRIKSDVAREGRRAGRSMKRASLDAEAAELKQLIAEAWKKQSGGGESIHSAMGLAKLDPEGVVTKLVVQLARNRVEAHIGLKAEALVDEVHGLLKDAVDLSRRDVAEMISGYGKTFEMSQDQVDIKLRELKSIIAANLGKADIIEKGIRPLRRGLQRDKPTQEVRAAMRELRDTLREHGMQVERSKGSPEEQQQSALDAAKTRARNRIEDLNKWIKDGKRTLADKTEIIPDAELTALHAERDRLQKVFEAIDDPAADQKKIENALRMVSKSVGDLEAKIRTGDLAVKQRGGGPTSPELEAARAEQKALRSILNDLRTAAKPEPSDVEREARKLLSANKALSTRMEKQIADLERRMAQGDFSKPPKREPIVYNKENLALQKQLERVKQDYSRANYKATRSRFGMITDELAKAANVPKTLKSMADISAMFRQGGFYAITHPIEGWAKPTAAMLQSFTETGFRNVENAIKNHPKFEDAKRDGVEFTGIDKNDPNLSKREEGYFGGETIDVLAKGKYNPLRIVKGTKDFSERTFVSFLDSQRLHMYDLMTEALKAQKLTRANAPESYKGAAKLINIGTGRGDLGKKGNQAAPFLNILMFSPRLVASRVQMLNDMFNPVAMARMPEGVRSQNIKDNVKFIAGTAAVMGLAAAAGGKVNMDPDDADFLKIRFGKTTYDTLTGLQQPMRYIVNMARAATEGEKYPGQSMADLTTRFARTKESPLAGLATDYISGEDFQGRKFNAKRAVTDIVTPLPAKDFIEAMQKEGLIKGFLKATPTVTGIGVQTYDERVEKPVTAAEKLARKYIKDSMPHEARDQEEIDKDQKKAELRARARAGENVTAELNALDLSKRQRELVLKAKGKTRLQEDFNSLDTLEQAVSVYETMNADEKASNRSVMSRKARELIGNLPKAKQEPLRIRLRALGLLPPIGQADVQRYFSREGSTSP